MNEGSFKTQFLLYRNNLWLKKIFQKCFSNKVRYKGMCRKIIKNGWVMV